LEVEAKFGILDERTFQRLLKATALAGFILEEPRVAELCDRCLDTAGGAFRFDIHQSRHRRLPCDGHRSVAELNLDRVRPQRGDDMAPTFLELEVELLMDVHFLLQEEPAREDSTHFSLQMRSRSSSLTAVGTAG